MITKTELLTKIFDFSEAKMIMRELITDSAQAHPQDQKPLTVKRFEIRIDNVDLLSWLAQQNFPTKIYGSDQTDKYAIAGVGQAHLISGSVQINHENIFQQMEVLLTPLYPYLRFYGGVCFDSENLDEEWKQFGAYRFVIPRFEIAVKEGKMLFACNVVVSNKEKMDLTNVLNELEALNYAPEDILIPEIKPVKRSDIPSADAWDKNIQTILQAQRNQKCQKVVLARKTEFKFNYPVNPWTVLRHLKRVTPYSYHFCFQFNGGEIFLGASPERLFKRTEKIIESEAIAGTRPRGTSRQNDEAHKEELLNSQKDRLEHQYVVDAIEEVMKSKCSHWLKEASTKLLSLENGHHLLASFRGELKESIKDWEILQTIHPTPAVGGSPNREALELIRLLEPFSRGWYAAPVGYVGLDQTEFVVAIRSALISDQQLNIYAGAGIVEGSNAQSEWLEVENKIGNFLKLLNFSS